MADEILAMTKKDFSEWGAYLLGGFEIKDFDILLLLGGSSQS
jgi:hypothetical protein